MSDYDQDIEYTWLFVLSIPTLYFLAFLVFYNDHLAEGDGYTSDCEFAFVAFPYKAFCEIDPLFNTAIGVLVPTQIGFIVCLMVYKWYELKRYLRCGDCWSVFIYS